MIRALIADDQPLARDGIAAVLQTQPDIEIIGQARDGSVPHVLTDDQVGAVFEVGHATGHR